MYGDVQSSKCFSLRKFDYFKFNKKNNNLIFFCRALSGQNPQQFIGGSFFNHSKFRYYGRTEREILSESLHSLKQSSTTSSPTGKRKASSVPATPSSPQELTDLRKT